MPLILGFLETRRIGRNESVILGASDVFRQSCFVTDGKPVSYALKHECKRGKASTQQLPGISGRETLLSRHSCSGTLWVEERRAAGRVGVGGQCVCAQFWKCNRFLIPLVTAAEAGRATAASELVFSTVARGSPLQVTSHPLKSRSLSLVHQSDPLGSSKTTKKAWKVVVPCAI